MDEPLILIGNKVDIESTLQAINVIAAAYWIEQGYTVVGDDLIGKNALTGEDDPESQKTTTWDVPKEHNGQWWILSPSNKEMFSLWKERLSAVGYVLKVEEKNKDWIEENA